MLNLTNCIALSLLLFCVGAFGVIARRNLLIVLMSVELMLNAANLALVAFSRHFALGGQPICGHGAAMADGGQVFALMSMAVAACEVALGLAILIALFRVKRTVLSTEIAEMQG